MIKIRLTCLPKEMEAAIAALYIAYDVIEVNEEDTNRRGRSRYVSRYADVELKAPPVPVVTGEKPHADGP